MNVDRNQCYQLCCPNNVISHIMITTSEYIQNVTCNMDSYFIRMTEAELYEFVLNSILLCGSYIAIALAVESLFCPMNGRKLNMI